MRIHHPLLGGLALLAGLTGGAGAAPAAALEGQWGGDRAQLSFHAGGAELDLECAKGSIPGPLKLGVEGRFDTTGTFEQLRGGPQRVDAQPASSQARYAGELRGQVLTLQVWPNASDAPLVFKLRKGATVKLVRCY